MVLTALSSPNPVQVNILFEISLAKHILSIVTIDVFRPMTVID